MNFSELVRACRYEVLPLASLSEQLHALPRDVPVTVTCSPARGIGLTLETTELLRREGFAVVPHLAARQVLNRSELTDIVRRLDDLGVYDVFVPGGDIAEPRGDYQSALELLRDLHELDHGFEAVGIAAYPEGHPAIPDESLDQALADKQSLATYMVTQMCFSASRIARWLLGVRARGIQLPVYLGTPGVLDKKKLMAISLKIGVGDSLRFLRKQNGARQLIGLGTYRPDSLIGDFETALAEDPNLAGLHIYTFNQIARTDEWRRRVVSGPAQAAYLEGDAP